MQQEAHTPSTAPKERGNHYSVTIKNCNSISEAHLTLKRESLNIKYGPNGIGKSTIARSLRLRAQGGNSLQDLLPFKFRDAESDEAPSVTGADEIQKVVVFDEHYVSQFVFQPDEVVKDSFEIFINTPEYREGVEELESMFEQLKEVFAQNKALDEVISAFTDLRDAFTTTKAGAIAKTSKGFKALTMGGKLANIPETLLGYEEFLHSDDPAGWLTWQSRGKSYLSLSENCPFCSIPGVDKKTATHVSEEYESAAVKNMSVLRVTIDRLARFFAPIKLEQLRKVTTSLGGLTPEQDQFLANLRGQIETLLQKFTALKTLSFMSLRDETDVGNALTKMKIDLDLLDALKSDDTQDVVDLMNAELGDIGQQINDIKRRVGIQKNRVAKSIERNQAEVNEYLKSAGYKYAVRIETSGESYRMILEHEDAAGHLEAAGSHLSYGERNAFALVLFMHQVRRDEPDLVILDDPVSSFDKTKKFAILHKLFHGKQSLRGFTTLLLTHDIEPAIDMVRSATSAQFQAATPAVHFLSSRDGHVSEKLIAPADIMTFSQVCDENINSSSDLAIKCIYLRRRYEVHGERGIEYDMLSSVLHLRDAPAKKDPEGNLIPLDPEEKKRALASIKQFITDFDYDALLAQLKDSEALKLKFASTTVGYEKVQLFRIATELNPDGLAGDAAFKKFINESYHIENEYVMQLNPRDFDAVPEHVIRACAELLG